VGPAPPDGPNAAKCWAWSITSTKRPRKVLEADALEAKMSGEWRNDTFVRTSEISLA
jgi:hypothetical protein